MPLGSWLRSFYGTSHHFHSESKSDRRSSGRLTPATRHSRRRRAGPEPERLEERWYLSALGLAAPDAAALAQAGQAYGQMPLSFEANQGQAEASANFLSHGSGYSLLLSPTEAQFALAGPGASDQDQAGTVLDMRLVGGNAAAQATGLDRQSGVSNYIIGNDPSQWITGVPNYGKVAYQNVYPGVDLVYHGNDQRHLEYDFVLAPGANPNAIQLSFEGTAGMSLDAQGNLVLHAASGDVVEQAPVAYQDVNGVLQAVSGHYVIEGGQQVGFQLGAYDASRPLVIYPTYSLVYSTYLGGSGGSVGRAIAVDGSGDAYVTGSTWGGFPTTQGALQTKYNNTGYSDAFVTKLNPTGTGLVYSTYLGASKGNNNGLGIALYTDPTTGASDAYINGTAPTNFPTTANAYSQTSSTGGVFVAKLNGSGSSLLYSSYLPAGNRGIAVDSAGNAYLTGGASALVLKVNPALAGAASLVYTFGVGGSGNGYSIAVDSSGDAYVTGFAGSGFPTTPGAFQTTNPPYTAFVSEVNPAGNGFVYSTLLGATDGSTAQGNGIAVNSSGQGSRPFPAQGRAC